MPDDTRLCPVCRVHAAVIPAEDGGVPRFCAVCWDTQREKCVDPPPAEVPEPPPGQYQVGMATLHMMTEHQTIATELIRLGLLTVEGIISRESLRESVAGHLLCLATVVRQQIHMLIQNAGDQARWRATGKTPEDDPLDPAVEAEQQRYGDLCDTIRGLADKAIPASAADLRPEHEALLAILDACGPEG